MLKKEQQANLKKHQGNKFLTNKDYDKAIKAYTEGIEIYDQSHLLFRYEAKSKLNSPLSNRCWVFMLMKQWAEALADANRCIELQSDFVKAHYRKGCILLEMNQKEEALKALIEAHDLEPKDEEILALLNKVKAM